MARYPRYERTGSLTARAHVPGMPDFADAREQQRNAQILGASADRMFQFAMKGVEKQARHQGARDAASAPEATLQKYQANAPQTAYEESAYATAVNISATRIETEARTEMNSAWLDWQKNWQQEAYTPETLVTKMTAIQTGYSEALANLDPVAAQNLSAKLEMHGQSLHIDVAGTYLKQQAKEQAAQAVRHQVAYQGDFQRFARRAESNAEMFDGGLSVRLRNFRAGQLAFGVDPATVERSAAAMEALSHEDRVWGQFSRLSSPEEQKDFLEKFKADQNDGNKLARGLDSKQIQTLISRMKAAPGAHAAAMKRIATRVKSTAGDYFRNLGKGYDTRPGDLVDLEKQAHFSGDPEAIKAVNLLREGVNLRRRMVAMPVVVAEDHVTRMRNAIAGGASPEAADLTELAEGIVATAKTGLSTDQVGYHNTIVNPEEPMAGLSTENLVPTEENFAKIRDRVQSVNAFSASMGNFAPLYFTAAEKQHFTTFFSDARIAPETKLAAVMTLNKASPGGSITLLQQLTDNAGPMVVAAGLVADGNNVAALHIMQGVEADALGLKPEGEPQAPVFGDKERAEIFDSLLRSGETARPFQFGNKTIATTRSAAKMMFLGMYQTDIRAKQSPEEYYTRAVQTTLGAKYGREDITHGGIHETRKPGALYGKNFAGHKVLLSPQMPVQHFRWLEDNLNAEDAGLTKEHLVAHDLATEGHQGWPKVGNKASDDARIEDLRQATFAPGSRPGWARLLTPQGDGYQDGYEVNLVQLHLLMTRKFSTQ